MELAASSTGLPSKACGFSRPEKKAADPQNGSALLLLEKLNYIHGNPVKRRLAMSPEEWPWSSFRFYHLKDSSVLPIDHLP